MTKSFILIIILCGFVLPRISTANSLSIDFLSVGQGESTLIHCPNGELILVDAGSSYSKFFSYEPLLTKANTEKTKHGNNIEDTRLAVTNYLRRKAEENQGSKTASPSTSGVHTGKQKSNSKSIPKVELGTLIITHPDTDHYNLLSHINKKKITFKQIYIPGRSLLGNPTYNKTLETLSSHTNTLLYTLPPQELPTGRKHEDLDARVSFYSETDVDKESRVFNNLCGEAKITVLAANGFIGDTDHNQQSIILGIKYEGEKILLTGDATNENIAQIFDHITRNEIVSSLKEKNDKPKEIDSSLKQLSEKLLTQEGYDAITLSKAESKLIKEEAEEKAGKKSKKYIAELVKHLTIEKKWGKTHELINEKIKKDIKAIETLLEIKDSGIFTQKETDALEEELSALKILGSNERHEKEWNTLDTDPGFFEDITILSYPHHGSYNTSSKWLRANPRIILLSPGTSSSKHSHPDCRVYSDFYAYNAYDEKPDSDDIRIEYEDVDNLRLPIHHLLCFDKKNKNDKYWNQTSTQLAFFSTRPYAHDWERQYFSKNKSKDAQERSKKLQDEWKKGFTTGDKLGEGKYLGGPGVSYTITISSQDISINSFCLNNNGLYYSGDTFKERCSLSPKVKKTPKVPSTPSPSFIAGVEQTAYAKQDPFSASTLDEESEGSSDTDESEGIYDDEDNSRDEISEMELDETDTEELDTEPPLPELPNEWISNSAPRKRKSSKTIPDNGTTIDLTERPAKRSR